MNDILLGAIAGDIIGSPYEFDAYNHKSTDFPLFGPRSGFTDDSVMTLAVAEALLDGYRDEKASEAALVHSMRRFGRLYPDAGYGGRFSAWLVSPSPRPYDSFGNGSAMRVSPAAWLYDSLPDVERFAAVTARVTHSHPEGVKGAQSVAAAICLARAGASKDEILSYVESTYHYPISSLSCDAIRPAYHMDESCQGTVPQAFCAFREGSSFESVCRLAVSLGGDSDTLAAIAASIAEPFYSIPPRIAAQVLARIPPHLRSVLDRFNAFFRSLHP